MFDNFIRCNKNCDRHLVESGACGKVIMFDLPIMRKMIPLYWQPWRALPNDRASYFIIILGCMGLLWPRYYIWKLHSYGSERCVFPEPAFSFKVSLKMIDRTASITSDRCSDLWVNGRIKTNTAALGAFEQLKWTGICKLRYLVDMHMKRASLGCESWWCPAELLIHIVDGALGESL